MAAWDDLFIFGKMTVETTKTKQSHRKVYQIIKLNISVFFFYEGHRFECGMKKLKLVWMKQPYNEICKYM